VTQKVGCQLQLTPFLILCAVNSLRTHYYFNWLVCWVIKNVIGDYNLQTNAISRHFMHELGNKQFS
jgi:hypothetical protein